MDINDNNINLFFDRYIKFVDNLCENKKYETNIKHVLYLIVPAFVIKYGIKEERNILSCFENVDIHIGQTNNKNEIAYFNRRLYSKEEEGIIKYATIKEIVINNYYNVPLLELIDSVIHEFNHAVNSIINEIKWNDEEVSIRTGIAYINFYRNDINKVKSRSKDVTLEEIINTTQTESIINIINDFSKYTIEKEEISNALYTLKHDIDTNGYHSNAYYFQSYICKELTKNKTFISTIENLRYRGTIEDIEKWFDDITGISGSYNRITSLLDEILKDEIKLANVKFLKKYKINKIKSKSKEVLDIVKIFDNNCIYK